MLRINGSDEYINATQVDAMCPHLEEFWNSSVSWTTTDSSWTTISFIGTDIWAYGLAGPNQGSFVATIDNSTAVTCSAESNDTDYHRLLFNATGLEDGPVHTLRLTNKGSTSLAFDYAVAESLVIWHKSTPSFDHSSSSAVSPASTPATFSVSATTAEGTTTAAAATTRMPTDDTATKLAAISTPYSFKWSAWSYFVVIFGAILFTVLVITAAYMSFRRRARSRREVPLKCSLPGMPKCVKVAGAVKKSKGKEKEVSDGESNLIQSGRQIRRTTRLLEALRGKKISPPLANDNGSITTGESGWVQIEGQEVSYGNNDDLDMVERGGRLRQN